MGLASPLESLFKLDERQLAALIVLLVVVPGAVEELGAMHARNTAPQADAAAATPAASRGGRSRHVRPPRSC